MWLGILRCVPARRASVSVLSQLPLSSPRNSGKNDIYQTRRDNYVDENEHALTISYPPALATILRSRNQGVQSGQGAEAALRRFSFGSSKIYTQHLASWMCIAGLCSDVQLSLREWEGVATHLRPRLKSAAAPDLAKIFLAINKIAAQHLNNENGSPHDDFIEISDDIVTRFQKNPEQLKFFLAKDFQNLIIGSVVGKHSIPDELRRNIVTTIRAELPKYVPQEAVHLLRSVAATVWPERQEIAGQFESLFANCLPRLSRDDFGMLVEALCLLQYRATKINVVAQLLTHFYDFGFAVQVPILVYCVSYEKSITEKQLRWCVHNLEPYESHLRNCRPGMLTSFSRILWQSQLVCGCGVRVAQSIANFCLNNLDCFTESMRGNLAAYLSETLQLTQSLALLDPLLRDCKDGDTLLRCLYALTPHATNAKAKALVAKLAPRGHFLSIPTELTVAKTAILCHTLNKWRLSYGNWLSAAGEVILGNTQEWAKDAKKFNTFVSLVHALAMLAFVEELFWSRLVAQLNQHFTAEFLQHNPCNFVKLLWSCVISNCVWEFGEQCLFNSVHEYVSDLTPKHCTYALQIGGFLSERGYHFSYVVHEGLFQSVRSKITMQPEVHADIAKELECLYGSGRWATDVATMEGCLIPFAGLWHWKNGFLHWSELPASCQVSWRQLQNSSSLSREETDPLPPSLLAHLLGTTPERAAEAQCEGHEEPHIQLILDTKQLLGHYFQPVAVFAFTGRSYLLNDDVLYGNINANLKLLQLSGWVLAIARFKQHFDRIERRKVLEKALHHAVTRCRRNNQTHTSSLTGAKH